jgi:hypothetical protein
VLLLGACLFLYLILRAIFSPILHGEIATFYHYIQPGKFIPPDALWDANNHVLNSFLSWVSYQFFGSEPWALRLPNVLSFVLFFWSSYSLSTLLNGTVFRWSFLLAMTMAHYMFEYFGETRGYGMSMAFLLAAMACALSFFRSDSLRSMIGTLLFIWLATLANLTLIYSYLLLLVAVFISVATQASNRKALKFTLVGLALIALSPLLWFAMELKHRGALYYGGKSGFWEYTGNTLTKLYTGHYSVFWAVGLTILFVLVVVFYLRANWRNSMNLSKLLWQPATLWVYLLIGSLLAIFATRYLLDVNFPEDRAAMYLYPYFIGSVLFVFNQSWKESATSLFVLPAVCLFYFPVNFVQRMNIHTATFSMEERAPQEFFDALAAEPFIEGYPALVGGAHTQELCWFYMNYQADAKQGKLHYTGHIDTLCDFQLVDVKRPKPSGFDNLYTRLSATPVNNLNLYQRKKKATRELVFSKSDITNWNHSDDEFFGFLDIEVHDSFRKNPLFVGVQATLHSPAKPFVAALVVSQKNTYFEEVHQEVLHLNWLRNAWDNAPNNLNHGIMIPYIYPETKYLVVYLWNQHQVDFLVHQGKCELFGLKFSSDKLRTVN